MLDTPEAVCQCKGTRPKPDSEAPWGRQAHEHNREAITPDKMVAEQQSAERTIVRKATNTA